MSPLASPLDLRKSQTVRRTRDFWPISAAARADVLDLSAYATKTLVPLVLADKAMQANAPPVRRPLHEIASAAGAVVRTI